jgi:outer membrane immunogenic protein
MTRKFSTKKFLTAAFVLSIAAAGPALAKAKPKVVPPPPPAPIYNWAGFYLGGNVGYSWGRQGDRLLNDVGTPVEGNTANLDGVIGGGQIGYNWQFDKTVLGIEADLDASGQTGNGNPLFTHPPGTTFCNGQVACFPGGVGATLANTDKLNWFGTVRGRLGWAVDRWLPYVTGGWAYGQGTISGTTTTTIPTTNTFSGSQNYSGWTIGGGLEWAFLDHWTARAEYLYINFGNGPTVAASARLSIAGGNLIDNIGRAGLNYKF